MTTAVDKIIRMDTIPVKISFKLSDRIFIKIFIKAQPPFKSDAVFAFGVICLHIFGSFYHMHGIPHIFNLIISHIRLFVKAFLYFSANYHKSEGREQKITNRTAPLRGL